MKFLLKEDYVETVREKGIVRGRLFEDLQMVKYLEGPYIAQRVDTEIDFATQRLCRGSICREV